MFRKFLTVILAAAVAVMPLSARKVKGSVSSQGNPLRNVIVTDGYRFTRTSDDGSFKLNTHKDARYVFVITPSGYTADYSSGSPQFYLPLKGNRRFRFLLQPFGQGNDYTIFSVSDPQMQNAKHLKRFKDRPLEDLIPTDDRYRCLRRSCRCRRAPAPARAFRP